MEAHMLKKANQINHFKKATSKNDDRWAALRSSSSKRLPTRTRQVRRAQRGHRSNYSKNPPARMRTGGCAQIIQVQNVPHKDTTGEACSAYLHSYELTWTHLHSQVTHVVTQHICTLLWQKCNNELEIRMAYQIGRQFYKSATSKSDVKHAQYEQYFNKATIKISDRRDAWCISRIYSWMLKCVISLK
jgi:hypothetical protein